MLHFTSVGLSRRDRPARPYSSDAFAVRQNSSAALLALTAAWQLWVARSTHCRVDADDCDLPVLSANLFNVQ
jgi:hypothetical protein